MSWIRVSPKRAKPIRRQSKKRRAELKARREVMRTVIERDGPECMGRRKGFIHECREPFDFHELRPRSQYPGGHLDADNVVYICRTMHDWIHDHPVKAFELGLLKSARLEAQRDV